MPRGPFSGRKTKIADAQEQGGRDKFQPGTYVAKITRGVYVESKNVNGAEYFGVETLVTETVSGKSAEENRPYQRSQRSGEAASWVFNLNPPNANHQYLADGNVKNLVNAIMHTDGFDDCLTEEEDEILGILMEAYEGGKDLTDAEMKACDVDDPSPDPFAYVANLLVEDGGEKFAGLGLRVVARDARDRKKVDARPFVACTCYAIEAEATADAA